MCRVKPKRSGNLNTLGTTNEFLHNHLTFWPCFAYQGKDIVFRFIIEYSSLRDFGPLGNNNRSNFV